MIYSLADILIGPQYPEVPPVVVGALGELGLWLADGDRQQAERELVAALPETFAVMVAGAGYRYPLHYPIKSGGDAPVIVTCLFAMEPDTKTGWLHPLFVSVVRENIMGAFVEVEAGGGVLWFVKP